MSSAKWRPVCLGLNVLILHIGWFLSYFSIGNDFSFDDAVAETYHCSINAFDPRWVGSYNIKHWKQYVTLDEPSNVKHGIFGAN